MTYPRQEKPAELVRLFDVTEALFAVVQETFSVPATYQIALHDVDRLDGPPEDELAVAAFTLRETQALRRAATAGVAVTNIDVVRIACTLDATLEQLVHVPGAETQAPTLLQVRDRINEAARVAAALGSAVDGGIVELY